MIRVLSSIILCLGLAACAVGPDYQRPELLTPARYAGPSLGDTGKPASPAPWWRGFEDETLDDLIRSALENNRDLEAARARLEEARSLIGAEKAAFLPGFDAEISGSATRELDGPQRTSENAEAAGLFSFVPDLFGRTRRSVEAAEAEAQARAALLADLERTTVAAVAATYVEVIRTEARLALLSESLALQQRTLEIVEQRSGAGIAPSLDVKRAEADLAQTRSERGRLEIARSEALNALAVLTGRHVGALNLDRRTDVPDFVDEPAVGAPIDLLRNRGDLRAAEAFLAAATAEIGVETADLYPSLRLPGSVAVDLTDPAGMTARSVAQISAVLDLPIFDGGARRAEVGAAEARAREALVVYEAALLQALSDVEQSLVAVRARAARQKDLAEAIAASRESFEQFNALYQEGLASFIDVLDAQRTLISSRESFVDSQADVALATIRLHESLGVPVRR